MVIRIPDSPAPVDVRAIEREVNRLWQAASERPELAGAGGAPEGLTRICMLTLVAVARDASTLSRLTDVIQRLTPRYPSRSILVRCGATGSDELGAWVSVHCEGADRGRPRVCCEQIVLAAGGRALSRVPGIVLPLLVPDLPVYLWWGEDVPMAEGAAAEVARHLVAASDCLVVDSATTARPLTTLAAAAALAAPLTGGLRDLTWGRLTPWREVIAQSFEPAPMAAMLDRLERVAVAADATGSEADTIEALLLIGWLASRLGWEVLQGSAERHAGGIRVLCRRSGAAASLGSQPGETVSVEIRGGPGPVSAVELCAGGPDPACAVLTRGRRDDGYVEVEIRPGRGRPRRHTIPFAVPDDVALLAAELDLVTPSRGLARALDLVRRAVPGA